MPVLLPELSWLKHETDGYRFFVADLGSTLRVYSQRDSWFEMECTPSIGTSLDHKENPTYTFYSHFIWVWFETEKTQGCLRVSKHEDWYAKGPSRPQISQRQVNAQRARVLGQHIIFFHQVEDRSYTMPPKDTDDGIELGDILTAQSSNYSDICDPSYLPPAVWTEERGFVALDLKEIPGIYNDYVLGRLDLAGVELARNAGWYYVMLGGPRPYALDEMCWHVPNQDDVPTEPCLHCQP